MTHFKKLNIFSGWILFGVATIVYWLTVEPTASYWDCSEFIAVAYKLEVPHPPGAPLFLLIGRLFSFLAFGDVEKVAYWINIVSVLSSGFTILFLFWTITMLARKLLKKSNDDLNRTETLVVLGSGAVGALVFTFSDSFWFSAVEAEVYALSSFFAAFVVWAILRWEQMEDERNANRWLLLIFYMMGLSIGVHLLNLVTIPAIGLIYYYKKHSVSRRGVFVTLAISGAIIIFVNDFIIPGLPSLAGRFERFFTNSIGLPFNTGMIFFALLVLGSIMYGLYKTHINGSHRWNTTLLSLTFLLIGYASYSVILIRSNFDTPIDENNPENLMNFVSYLKREQYGSRPLLYGQYFDTEKVGMIEKAPIWEKGEERYTIKDYKLEYDYDPAHMTILPRVYSDIPDHVSNYRKWINLRQNEKPDFSDNLKFMFRYQLGYMYLRYFLWNFAGRESDIQGADWLSPLSLVKETPQLFRENRGRNNYFMLPLILGLLGMFYSYRRSPRVFNVLLILFFMLGMALVLYLNSPPTEPRERDYIYVGSFFAYAIWIGLGVMAIYKMFYRFLKRETIAVTAAILCGLSIPLIMAVENWDDHNRSGRYFSVDSARNFLESCAPNAVLFTGGDNDTFPLWYAQEVEGIRTDVRVIVLSYFNTDWYIEQMTRRAYNSDPLPFGLGADLWRQGGPNDYLYYVENPSIGDKAINLHSYMNLVRQDHKAIKIRTTEKNINSIPSRSFYLPVDRNKIIEQNIVPKALEDTIPERMDLRVKKNGIEKSTLMILDMITNDSWQRPIYFTNTALRGFGVDISNYVVQEGNTFRLLPAENPNPGDIFINTDTMYTNVMEKFAFRGLDNPDVYYSDTYRGMITNQRITFNSLTNQLIRQGDLERAKQVIDRNLEVMPDETVPYDLTTLQTVSQLIFIGDKERGVRIAKLLGNRAEDFLNYSIKDNQAMDQLAREKMYTLNEVTRLLKGIGENDLSSNFEKAFLNFYDTLNK